MYEFVSNLICKYWNLAVNQLSRNLQVLEFEGKVQFREECGIRKLRNLTVKMTLKTGMPEGLNKRC